MNASELIVERAALLERLAEINAALQLLNSPAAPVEINTSRNLRNTYPFVTDPSQAGKRGILVFADQSLSVVARPQDHEGWVSAADAARLRVEFGGEDWSM
jgi:hypothetical protein